MKLETAPDIMIFKTAKDFERMSQFIFKQEFNDLVTQVNENYYYWDKVKYLELPAGVTHDDLWAIARIRRQATPYKVEIGDNSFTWNLTGKIQELLHMMDMNIGGSLESRSLIQKDEKNRYLISSIMEEAIASSQIEGAVTTRKEAKEMLRKNRTPRNKSEQMILNNYITIQKILEIKDEDLTVQRLLEIHRLISSNTIDDKKDEGAFRNSNDINVVDVIDGSIVYSPPAFDKIPALIEQLSRFFNTDSDNQFIHPIVKGCVIHFLIGYIHPFVDGNGRTARALFYWYLLKKGYWLTEYLSISKLILKSKAQYARAFLYSEVDQNDLTYFINYKLKTMRLAYKALREYIQRKIEEKKQVAEFMRIDGINDRQALILKWFYEEPTLLLTVKEVENRLNVSNQTARNDLQGLGESGFLSTIKMNRKTEAFSKSDNFDNILKTRLRHQQLKIFP